MITDKLLRIACLLVLVCPLSALAEDAWDGDAVARLQADMASGATSSRKLVEQFLARIDAIDVHGPKINSVIEVNPDALKIADEMDAERARTGPRGPMHGIPVLLKDNIDTADRMLTTAGSLALVGSRPAQDAFLVTRLRAAGAVILGKTNLSEWANFRSTRSTSGWSGRGGLTRNPYALDRNSCGSSTGSGAAIAANLAPVAVGTETDGSIVCPSSINGLAGIKPTVGLVSRSGVIPISASQDTAGPMARSVADAVALLGAHGRRGSEGCRDQREVPAGSHRLQPVPESGRIARCAHRRGAQPGRLRRPRRQTVRAGHRSHARAGCRHRGQGRDQGRQEAR